MQIIDELEPTKRGLLRRAIGLYGFNGNSNHAIMIRNFLSWNNTLVLPVRPAFVAASIPENELQEVNNKLNALKKPLRWQKNRKWIIVHRSW